MGFDVAPAPVRRQWSRLPAIAVVAVGIAVVAVALATTDPGPSRPADATPAVSALEAAASRVPVASLPSPAVASTVPARPARPARLPATIECHDLGTVTCGQLARATMAILPADGPPVAGIEAWGSILCGDNLDCPPQRFVGYRPLGSTVVSFMASGIRAWVNVVEPAPFPGRVWDPARTVAWVVRWQP